MSLFEPRCLVCGAPLDKGAPFEKEIIGGEVCSDKCYEIYMTDDDYEGESYEEE
jgi:predicted nucleic acid-binding Zn ribbon protein